MTGGCYVFDVSKLNNRIRVFLHSIRSGVNSYGLFLNVEHFREGL